MSSPIPLQGMPCPPPQGMPHPHPTDETNYNGMYNHPGFGGPPPYQVAPAPGPLPSFPPPPLVGPERPFPHEPPTERPFPHELPPPPQVVFKDVRSRVQQPTVSVSMYSKNFPFHF